MGGAASTAAAARSAAATRPADARSAAAAASCTATAARPAAVAPAAVAASAVAASAVAASSSRAAGTNRTARARAACVSGDGGRTHGGMGGVVCGAAEATSMGTIPLRDDGLGTAVTTDLRTSGRFDEFKLNLNLNFLTTPSGTWNL